MKQLAVISGKGGTGKTTLTACLVHLAQNKIIADCDVDAPNLHLALPAQPSQGKDFSGAKVAVISQEKCSKCGKCFNICRFGALEMVEQDYKVNNIKCEGCAACVYTCPEQALKLVDEITGKLFLTDTSHGKFAHALLDIGAEGSGKLVTEVRKGAQSLKEKEELLIIDGSPGIGCSVIASITGCNAVLAVSEPTQSGLHDLTRVVELANHFSIPIYLCLNKYDLNEEITTQIENFAEENQIVVVGKIPFDPMVLKALQQGKSLLEYPNSPASQAIKEIWIKIKEKIKEE